MSKKFLSPIRLAQGATNPATGSSGELFYNTTDLKVYSHNGTTWLPSAGGFTISDTPPTSPAPRHGDSWLDSSEGALYAFYDDGAGSPARTNLIANPSFATGLAGWSYSGVAMTSRSTTQGYSGGSSAQIEYIASQPRFYYQKIDVTQLLAYTASAYVKQMSSSSTFNVAIEWADSGGTVLSESQGSTANATTAGWTRASITVDAPAGAATAKVGIYNQSNHYVDAVMLEQSATLGEYIEGTVAGGSSGQWIQIQTTSAINSALVARAEALESDVTTLQAQTSGFEADVISLDSRTDSLESRATAVESRATVLEARNMSYNYIINGAMDIWQRGTSFAPVTNGAFTADRWQAQASVASTSRTIQQIALAGAIPEIEEVKYYLRSTVNTIGSGTNTRLRYKVEGADTLAGKTVTFSWYAKQNFAGNYRVLIQQNFGTGGSASVTAYDANTTYTTSWQRYSVTFVMPSIGGKTIAEDSFIQIELFQADTTGGVLEVTAVQLEAGYTTTPFRRNAPSIQAELAACQRYCYVKNHDGLDLMWGWGRWESNTFYCVFQHPVRMRALPSFTLVTPTGLQVVDPTVAWYTVASINSIHKNGVSASDVNFNMTGASVTNKTFGVMAVNSGTPKLIVSAEI